jgi:predicted transcriptional regulator
VSESVKFSSKMDDQVLAALRDYAQSSDRTVSSVLTEAVSEYLQRVRVRPAFRAAAEEVLDTHGELLQRLAR